MIVTDTNVRNENHRNFEKKYETLVQRGRKNQTFDDILTEVLQKSGLDADFKQDQTK
jgi:hypothetical protein